MALSAFKFKKKRHAKFIEKVWDRKHKISIIAEVSRDRDGYRANVCPKNIRKEFRTRKSTGSCGYGSAKTPGHAIGKALANLGKKFSARRKE